MATDWPDAPDFRMMLQNPEKAFRDPGLKGCTLEKDSKNQPIVSAGGFANVYKAKTPDGRDMAIRVFIKSSPNRQKHYRAISRFLDDLKTKTRPKQTPAPSCLVDFQFWDDEIRTPDGKRWPLVTMDWVPGVTLDKWVSRCVSNGKRDLLKQASENWVELIKTLIDLGIAHGDLQHGNVMVTEQDAFRLVDYDGMCVPGLQGEANIECGLPPYQHPKRNAETKLSPQIDNFSGILIYTVLRALAVKPELWKTYVTDISNDNMLFRTEDWKARKGSDLYSELRRCSDVKVKKMVELLFNSLEQAPEDVPPLPDVLDPYEEVMTLFSQRSFDDAVELLERSYKSLPAPPEPPADTPEEYKPQIREARARVACRRLMLEAVQTGNEREMQRLFREHSRHRPPLLDQYPQAERENLTEIAQHSERVLELIEELERAKQSIVSYEKERKRAASPSASAEQILSERPWRQLVAVWFDPQNQPLLEDRRSTRKLRESVENWRDRNRRCDAVLQLWGGPNLDTARLADDWKRLGAAGHPETDPHELEIQRILEKAAVTKQFEAVLPRPPERPESQSGDQQMSALWKKHRQLFSPSCEIAVAVGEARSRLENVKRIRGIVGKTQDSIALDPKEEQSIVKIHKSFPEGYAYDYRERALLAYERLKALKHFSAARDGSPISDRALAPAWNALLACQADSLITAPAVRKRAEVAVKRVVVLDQLPDLELKINQRDEVLIKHWNEKLLAKSQFAESCSDADPWREPYRDAIRRKEMLHELRLAVVDDDWSRIASIAFDELFSGYVFPREWQSKFESIGKRRTHALQLREALDSDNREQFVAHFNTDSVRLFSGLFEQSTEKLCHWVRSEILPPTRLGLKKTFDSNDSIPVERGRCRLRWLGPHHRYTEECLITVTRNMPKPSDDLDSLEQKLEWRQPQLRHNPAGTSLNVKAKWQGCYVAVWAIIDIGCDRLCSEPLILGKLRIP
jgi:serine/threonine protein kinase